VYYANRAAAHIKLESYGAAVADAEKSTELDPKYIKASRWLPSQRTQLQQLAVAHAASGMSCC
jgi:hypothetical protein